MLELYPLLMRPSYKDYLWGGQKLRTFYGKNDGPETIAESWELADHIDGNSKVANGHLKGKTIEELGKMEHDRIWGKSCGNNKFPIIVKLIDAKEKLSVQVHPSEECCVVQNCEEAKAELWYIVECERDSFIYLGLKKDVSRAELMKAITDNTICELLNKVYVNRGDVYFVNPCTIHAIGAGIMVAEIQQNSNTTFRLYDYNRKDTNGNYRKLHLDRALDIVDLSPTVPSKCRNIGSMSFDGFKMIEMYTGKPFKAYKVVVSKEIALCCDGSAFHHILCVGGNGHVEHNGRSYEMEKGLSYLMPAELGEYKIIGNCEVLLSKI